MDFLLEALLLGIVEGLTEFLPVSGTGHLIITADLLDYTGEKAKTFEVIIQLVAILAVCWLYRARLAFGGPVPAYTALDGSPSTRATPP